MQNLTATVTKVIVISGASSGLGAALAEYYAQPGTQLALIGRHAERLNNIADRCRHQGASVQLGIIDITDEQELTDWLIQLDRRHPVDLIIANAGISNHIGYAGEAETIAQIDHVFAVNVKGVLNTIHPLLDNMRQRKRGQIALVSSLAAYRGMAVTPAYCASKAAVKAYGEALRAWLAPEGIKINIICPGFVSSAMSDQFPGSRPFLLSAPQAAAKIAQGLHHNRAIISFPFPLNWSMWCLSVLPFPIAEFFLRLSGYHQAQKIHIGKP